MPDIVLIIPTLMSASPRGPAVALAFAWCGAAAFAGSLLFFLYSYLLVQQTSPTNYFNLASLIAIILVGACAGFLPLNWRPAKLFMGDAGALLVGLLMATSAVAVTGQLNPTGVGLNQFVAASLRSSPAGCGSGRS